MLDETTRNEIKGFVETCQLPSGAFTDRAGNADFYYSFFGVLITSALEMNELTNKYKNYIQYAKPPDTEGTLYFAYQILYSILSEKKFQKPSVLNLYRILFSKSKKFNPAYRLFMWMLTLDLFYRKRRSFVFLSKMVLLLYKPNSTMPCSVVAAYTVARKFAGLNASSAQKLLYSFFEEGRGFKIFHDVNHPDLLSTAVALFALKATGADLRQVAPCCLYLVQQNFADGAFLSGDGDGTRDLEYTFYGLLTLGVLLQHEKI